MQGLGWQGFRVDLKTAIKPAHGMQGFSGL